MFLNIGSNMASSLMQEEEDDSVHQQLRDSPSTSQDGGRESNTPTYKDLFHCTTENLPTKVYYFCFYGALGSLYPYISIYFKQLGLGPGQIGLILGLPSLIGLGGDIVWSGIAAKTRLHRWILLVSILCWISFYLGIAFVPSASRSQICINESHDISQFFSPSERAWDNFTNQTNVSTISPAHFTTPSTTTAKPTQAYYISNANTTDLEWVYEESSLHAMFIAFVVIVLIGSMFQCPSSIIADTTASDLNLSSEQDENRHEIHRACRILGWGLGAFCVGAVISQSRHPVVICGITLIFSDYTLAFYAFASLMFVGFLSASQFQFKEIGESTSKYIYGGNKNEHFHVCRLFENLHNASWLAVVIYMGLCSSIIAGYLFWHVDNLGGSQVIMAVASLFSCLVELNVWFFRSKVYEQFDHDSVVCLALAVYAFRFLVYATMNSPWWILFTEIFQGATLAMVWPSVTSYFAQCVPRGLSLSVQNLLHMLYWGIGPGVGSCVGGLLIGYAGAATIFKTLSVISIIVAICFLIIVKCSRKPEGIYTTMDSMELGSLTSYSFEDSQADFNYDGPIFLDDVPDE